MQTQFGQQENISNIESLLEEAASQRQYGYRSLLLSALAI
jgi:hypothetical protein